MKNLILTTLQDGGLPAPTYLDSSSSAPVAETQVPTDGTGPGPGAPQGGLGGMLLPLAILFGFMWLFVIRPERKRQKKRTEMLSAISKGDKVVTVGGMHGEVVRLEEKTVTVKVADNLRLKFDRSAIARPSSAEEGDPVSAEISTAPGG